MALPHKCTNETRIARLESQESVMGVEIKNLIKQLDNLTGWIKSLVIMVLTSLISAFGYLIVEWIKG